MKKEAHVLRGTALIDLNASPAMQEGRWGSITHVRQGIISWNPRRAWLYLTEAQQSGATAFNGFDEIWETVQHLPVVNACGLDYLLHHQDQIPESWRKYHLHFWGTIYREFKGDRFVRGLMWNKGRWQEIDTLVNGFGWSARCAAVRYPGLQTHAQSELREKLCA